jgi:hypothetical protein
VGADVDLVRRLAKEIPLIAWTSLVHAPQSAWESFPARR